MSRETSKPSSDQGSEQKGLKNTTTTRKPTSSNTGSSNDTGSNK